MYITGFCGSGLHEGVIKKSPSGKELKSCNGLNGLCECECHKSMEQMLAFIKEQLGDEAVTVIPAPVASSPTSNVTASAKASVTVTHAPVTVPPRSGAIPPDHPDDVPKALPNGRRGRGSLDYEVKQICDEWTADESANQCTPKWVSEKLDGGKTSTGAIDAVWRRWVQLGFAKTASKPTRFVGYTQDGLSKGLHRMKYEARQQKRRFR